MEINAKSAGSETKLSPAVERILYTFEMYQRMIGDFVW